MSNDKQYMQLALELAEKGAGNVEPNPMVGCVIVKDGQIIGQGYHEEFGKAHAEINAIANCKENGNNPAGAALYVTLEPCSHHGKTGPCCEAVIEAKIAKVVAAMEDPSEKVAGKGFQKLKQAAVEVEVGICKRQAKLLNPGFIKQAKENRPWVIVKWAQSKDGFLAWGNPFEQGQWISNEASREDVHKLRRSSQAIVVGVDTVIADDPMLTARPAGRKKALRVVMDSILRMPLGCNLLDTKQSPTLVVTTQKAFDKNPGKAEEIIAKGAEVLAVKETNGRCDISELMVDLGKRQIQTVMIEGGAKIIDSFIVGGYADAAHIYISPNELGEDGDIKASEAMLRLANKQGLNDIIECEFDGDVRITGTLV